MKLLKTIIIGFAILVLSGQAYAAIQVGRATAVVASTDVATTNIDVNVGFTPTAGAYFVLINWSGRSEATDTVGGATINAGIGMAVSSTSRRGVCGFAEDGVAISVTSKSSYDDAILKVLDNADAVVGALDFVGEITNGVRFIVDDQFPADVRFQVLVIDGLTGVGIFNVLEPAATGQVTHTGAGVDDAELFFFMMAGQTTSVPVVAGGLSFYFGAAHADGQFVVSTNSRDGQDTQDTYHYNTDLESIARQTAGAGAPPNARASFVATATDGVTLDWLERGVTNGIHFAAALKGIEATVANGLTQTDTTTDIAITGLGNTALGGIVVSNAEIESTQDTAGNNHHFSFGMFTSTSNRGAHATWDQDGQGDTESATCVEYDAVYCNISTADAVQGLMDIKSLDSGGATFIMDDADPAQTWFGTVLFATPAAAGATRRPIPPIIF